MPRRKYVNIRRHGRPRLALREAHYVSQAFIEFTHNNRPFSDKLVQRWQRQMGRGRFQPKSMLVEPARNGENHALSITCVLDLLLRIETDTAIHPSGFTAMLNEEYGHLVFFDPYTVGRIFSGLLEAVEDSLVDRPADWPRALDRIMESGARLIAVIDGATENRWWLGNAREAMGARAERDIAAIKEGMEPPRSEDTWAVLEEIPFAVVE